MKSRLMAEQIVDVDISKQNESGIVPRIVNVVSTFNLDCKLDVNLIASKVPNIKYNPERFHAVTMRILEPKTTVLIFSSGKIVCTGSKSEDESRLAATKCARIIKNLGLPVGFKDFKIQNIVASCDVGFPIRLQALANSHGECSSYEPEIFPGLKYRMKDPKIVVLVFASGKVVLTGAKTRDDTYSAFEKIYHVVKEFRRTTVI